jgi:quinoprotein dehydrogenase-associated probable ABC transporter substrate-binding protein
MRSVAAALIVIAGVLAAVQVGLEVRLKPDTSELRVCADPNNLPFSNDRGEGFENRIAELLARDLKTSVNYTWWAQRRGFIRNTLGAGKCDVVLGLPTGMNLVTTTRPYYRSSYVFVSRRAENLRLRSLDDPLLRKLRIGVQMIGDDFNNSPPAHALSARGIVKNVVGYSVLADYGQPNPPARIVDAVANGAVDAALVWGPLAGYFATREPVALVLSPVSSPADDRLRPFVFDISMGVRPKDEARRKLLDEFIARRRTSIDAILDRYGVPRVDAAPGKETHL